ncbi:MAG TPA: nucleotide exchange factor GrpE [Marmoricola sp.]|nr:nucleotide exchange factor GrpE [Marmoricola sp.]
MTDSQPTPEPEETPAQGADDLGVTVPDDISGIDNLLEEGGPLEPQDVVDVEAPLSVPVDPLEAAQQEAAERTADLQRLQAEFLNYKRRVDRDRDLVRENAVFAVLTPMLDVLDNLDRAREAGELEGGFKGVAEQLERIVSGLGLTRYGAAGDAFDPAQHEALSHVGSDPGVSVPTCQLIAKAGYKIGDRVVRAAQVLVVDPE